MRVRFWLGVVGTMSIANGLTGCGEPALDVFEPVRGAAPSGGARATPIGPRAAGGASGMATGAHGAAPASSGGGGRPSDHTPSAAGAPDISGEAGAAPGSAAGSAPSVRASGGVSATGGRANAGEPSYASGGAGEPAGGSSSAGELELGGSGGAHGGESSEPSPGPSGAGGAPFEQEPNGGAGSPTSAGAAGTPTEPGSPAEPAAVWFSEYVELGGKKALELGALSEQALEACRVEVFANGAATATASWALEGTTGPELPLVVCTRAVAEDPAVPSGACGLVRALTFTGDDAVLLRCAGQVVDAIGQVGTQPDEHWGSGEHRTADMTLRRLCSVTVGDAEAHDVFEPSLQWLPSAAGDLSGLGEHCREPAEGGATEPSPPATP